MAKIGKLSLYLSLSPIYRSISSSRNSNLRQQKWYASAIANFSKRGQWQDAVGSLRDLQGEGLEANKYHYTGVISACTRAGALGRAVELLNEALDGGITDLPLQGCASLISSLWHDGRSEDVLLVFKKIRAAGVLEHSATLDCVPSYTFAARACESLVEVKVLLDLYQEFLDMLQEGQVELVEAGMGQSLPCIVFRTLVKAKRHALALEHVEDALSATPYRNDILCNMAINCHGKVGNWEGALQVFKRMDPEYGIAPNSFSYATAINAYSKVGMWSEAVGLLNEMLGVKEDSKGTVAAVEGGQGIATSAFNSALIACDRAKEGKEALLLLNRAPEMGVKPDLMSHSTVMRALASSGQCAAAVGLLERMLALKLYPPVSQCNWVLTKFTEHRAGKEARTYLKAMKKAKLRATPLSYNAVISALYRSGQYESLLEVFREMQLLSILPDSYAVNQVVQGCVVLERWQELADITRGVWKVGGHLNTQQLNRIFGVFGRNGEVDLISGLLAEMEVRGLPIVEGCYTALISGLVRRGRGQDAYTTLKSLQAESASVGVAAYTSVITGCKWPKQWQLAMELFREMEAAPPEDQLAPNQFTYNAVIGVLSFSGRMDLAEEMFKTMGDAGIEYDEVTCTNMVLGYGEAERWPEVVAMFRRLDEVRDLAKQQDLMETAPSGPRHRRETIPFAVYSQVMTGCDHEDEWELARSIIERVRADGLSADVGMYARAMSACSKAGRAADVLALLNEMDQDGTPRSIECYSQAICASEAGGMWQQALRLLLQMINAGMEPPVVAFNAAIGAAAKFGDWKMALKLFESLRQTGVLPTAATYESALMACQKGNSASRALAVMRSMLNGGMQPSQDAVNMVVQLLEDHQELEAGAGVFWEVFKVDPCSTGGGTVIDMRGYSPAVVRAGLRFGLNQLKHRYAYSDPHSEPIAIPAIRMEGVECDIGSHIEGVPLVCQDETLCCSSAVLQEWLEA